MSEYVRSLGSDSSSHKARAIGLAGGNRGQTLASASDGTSAVVSIATVGTLNNASHGGSNERQNNGSLHFNEI
jgi:hypothetical protein